MVEVIQREQQFFVDTDRKTSVLNLWRSALEFQKRLGQVDAVIEADLRSGGEDERSRVLELVDEVASYTSTELGFRLLCGDEITPERLQILLTKFKDFKG